MPSGVRKNPVICTCVDCGKEFETRQCGGRALRCPECRHDHNKKQCLKWWHSLTPEQKKEQSEKRSARKLTPKQHERKKQKMREYYHSHKKDLLKKKHERDLLKKEREKRIARMEQAAARQLAEKNILDAQWAAEKKAGNVLRCNRLHLSAKTLPCGQYPCCHKCPQDMRKK